MSAEPAETSPLIALSTLRATRHAPRATEGRPLPLGEMLAASSYHGYLYAYPHKTAYRTLSPPVPLGPLWAAEDRSRLSLYIHVPFCEMRCGFCNLFAQATFDEEAHNVYLQTLRRQAAVVQKEIGAATFARVAVGGGTPTLLNERSFASLFDLIEEGLGASLARVPASVETSPLTATPEHLRILESRRVNRVSIGVQSFFEDETRAALRPQEAHVVERALDLLMASSIPTRNIDLIYGLPGQSPDRFLASVRRAVSYHPEELYLYPLYVRPATGLGKKDPSYTDLREISYRAARELLLSLGYEQLSMRNFRKRAVAPAPPPPDYSCQSDGMVGLGCGARSYTSGLHYAERWATGPAAVRAILAEYASRPDADFALARHGIALSEGERRRRYLILSLLLAEGLDLVAYEARFGAPALTHFPELSELLDHGLCVLDGERRKLTLTPSGLEATDTIGPWLVSPAVRALSAEYEDR